MQPEHIRHQLDGLERAFAGPIPTERKIRAQGPMPECSYTLHEIEAAIGHFRENARSNYLKLKAIAPRCRDGGMEVYAFEASFGMAARRLKIARLLRDQWIYARQSYLGLEEVG